MRQYIALLAVLALSGCATSPTSFYKDPSKPDTTSLCRAYFDAKDANYQWDVAQELGKRGMTVESCRSKVVTQNAVIGVAALAALGTGAAIACRNSGCAGGSGGYYPVYSSPQYGFAWDQISDGYGGRIWRCRDRSNGEFANDYLCSGPQIDNWPG